MQLHNVTVQLHANDTVTQIYTLSLLLHSHCQSLYKEIQQHYSIARDLVHSEYLIRLDQPCISRFKSP